MATPRILEVRTKILKQNDETARAMRQRFDRLGLLVVNLVSSPGTGKTWMIKQTLFLLALFRRKLRKPLLLLDLAA